MKLSKEQKILVLLGVIIGILYFWFSITMALKFISFIFEKEISTKILLILFGFPILVLLGFIVSAIGILYCKRWAFRLYLVSTILAWVSSIKSLFLINYHSILGISGILFLVLSGISIWFSLKKTTIEQFGLKDVLGRRKKLIIFNYIFITLVILAISYYAFSYFVIYPQERIVYAPKDDAYLSAHYVKRDISNLSMFLPQNMQIQSFWKKGCVFIMANPKGTVKVSVNMDPLGEFYKYFGYRNSYEFYRRLNRFGHFISVNFLKSRSRTEKIVFSDIATGESLAGFLTIFPKNNNQSIYEYRLYDKNNKTITNTILFLSSKNELSYDDISNLIGSLELRSAPLKLAEELFQEGLAHIDKNQYEEAKFSLANALYQHWEDPKYNYYLGVAFLRTNNYGQAKYFLEKSKVYLDAQILLKQIKDKFATETKNQDFGR